MFHHQDLVRDRIAKINENDYFMLDLNKIFLSNV